VGNAASGLCSTANGTLPDAGTYNLKAAFRDGAGNFADTLAPNPADLAANYYHVVVPASTIITIDSSSPNPSIYGNDVTFNFSLTSSSNIPGGTVTVFIDNGDGVYEAGVDTTICSDTLNASQNSGSCVSGIELDAGTYTTIRAYFASNNPNVASATSAPFTQTVNPAAASVVLDHLNGAAPSSADPTISAYGETLHFTFTVTNTDSSGIAPSGVVQVLADIDFDGDGTEDVLGRVLCSTSSLTPAVDSAAGSCSTLATDPQPAGSYTLSVVFNPSAGNPNFSTGVSPDYLHRVVLGTETSLDSITPSSATYGEVISFGFTVTNTATSVPPTGSVTVFRDDGDGVLEAGEEICVSASAGWLVSANSASGACDTSGLAVPLDSGSYTILAVFAGGTSPFAESTSSALPLTIGPAATSVQINTIVIGSNPPVSPSTTTPITATFGQNVTFNFAVANLDTSPVPVGTVTIFNDGNNNGQVDASELVCSAAATAGACSSASLSAGPYTLKAAFNNGSNFADAVGPNPADLTENYLLNVTPAAVGAEISLIGVDISGDAAEELTPSTDSGNPTDSAINLSLTFTVTVDNTDTSNAPTGTFTISADIDADGNGTPESLNVLLCTGTLDSVDPADTSVGIGACTQATPAGGIHTLRVNYNLAGGNTNFESAVGGPYYHAVVAPTTVLLSTVNGTSASTSAGSPTTSDYGVSVTFAISVTSSSNGNIKGALTVFNDANANGQLDSGETICTGAVEKGAGSCTNPSGGIDPLAPQSYTRIAVFFDSDNQGKFPDATSIYYFHTVSPASTSISVRGIEIGASTAISPTISPTSTLSVFGEALNFNFVVTNLDSTVPVSGTVTIYDDVDSSGTFNAGDLSICSSAGASWTASGGAASGSCSSTQLPSPLAVDTYSLRADFISSPGYFAASTDGAYLHTVESAATNSAITTIGGVAASTTVTTTSTFGANLAFAFAVTNSESTATPAGDVVVFHDSNCRRYGGIP
jgi:hypothetical protein